MLNVIEEFKTAMLNAGIAPPDTIIQDGKRHRFNIGLKPDGWYLLHSDGKPNGVFGNWKTGASERWKADEKTYYALAEREAHKAQSELNRAMEQQAQAERHHQAALKARRIWKRGVNGLCTYHHSKKIKPYGTRTGEHGSLKGVVIVPLYRLFGDVLRVANLQFIQPNGLKRFLSGGQKTGCFFEIGTNLRRCQKILICEGYATGASIHENTGEQVVIAFDAGNLEAVAKAIRQKRPDADLILMADNDLSGVGLNKAMEAAKAVNGRCVVCPVEGQDFNDFVNAGRNISEVLHG